MFISEEEFNKGLSYRRFNEALEAAKNQAIEATLKLLPEVLMGLIVKTKSIQQVYEAFKAEYPSIAGNEVQLAQIIEEIELEDGSLSLPEILQKVPERIKDLNLEVPGSQPHSIEEAERTANGFL